MWHLVDTYGRIVESVAALPPEALALPVGDLFASGWRRGVPSGAPPFNVTHERLVPSYTYDVRSAVVAEGFTVEALPDGEVAGMARARRQLEKQAIADPILKAFLKYGGK